MLNSEQVQDRIRKLASSRVDRLLPDQSPASPTGPNKMQKNLAIFKERKRRQIEQQLREEALAILQVSVARIDSLSFLKFFAATVNNILARMYHQGIHISVPQVLELRRVAAYAAERKQSILFLPCHKSHIDYLTVSWLMFRLGIALPHIIAGENLDLPVLGDVLRKGGAFSSVAPSPAINCILLSSKSMSRRFSPAAKISSASSRAPAPERASSCLPSSASSSTSSRVCSTDEPTMCGSAR